MKTTKNDKLLLKWLEDNKLTLDANIQVQHVNESVAQAFTVIIQALGIKLSPVVAVKKKKAEPKAKKAVKPRKKKK